MSIVKQYRKKYTKEVKLPSGFTFKIRKMNVEDLYLLTKIYGNRPIGELEARELLPDVVKTILPRCVIEPKIAEKPSENALGVDELTADDVVALITEIMAFGGVTGPAAEERKK